MTKQQTKPKPLEQTKLDTPSDGVTGDLEVDCSVLEAQIESHGKELEAKRAQLAAARVVAAAKAAERQKQIEAETLERKINEFVNVAAKLDHYGMSAEALTTFKRLASEISFAGRLKQAHAARESLISRQLGQTVYRPPFPSWAAMAQAWLVMPTPPETPETPKAA
jgi:hypothetical protein